MNIKRTACVALAKFLNDMIPEFAGEVKVQWGDEEEVAVWPALRILPQKMAFTPWQDDELDDTADHRLVLSVGDFEGTVELRLFAKSQPEREEMGQKVLDAFLLKEGAPGVITTVTEPVIINVLGEGEEVTLYQAPASFMLDDETWNDEMVFSKKRFDYMNVSAVFPALVARQAYDINYLHLAITNDLDATEGDEEVVINPDGSITSS